MMAQLSKPSMRRFVDCEEDKPVLHEDEILNYQLENIEIAFEPESPLGNFTLYITTSRFILIGQDLAFEFDVPFIIMHALSRDPDSYHKPCIYCQLDQEEGESPDELFLAPANPDVLTEIFEQFSHAASLNPDPPEPGEEEGDDELIYNLDEVTLGAQQAQTLAHLESVFDFVSAEEQFADCEDEVQEENEGNVEGEGSDAGMERSGGMGTGSEKTI